MSDDKYNNDDIGEEEQGGIEDFPKEIVQLLMRNHPIRNPEYNTQNRESRDEARVVRRRRFEEEKEQLDELEQGKQLEFGSMLLNEEPPYEVEEQKDTRKSYDYKEDTRKSYDYKEDTRNLFDDEEEMVQLIRRANRPSNQRGYRRGFHPENVNELDQIEKSVSEERRPRPRKEKVNKQPPKKVFEDRDEEYYKIKKPEDKHRVLDDFFEENSYGDDDDEKGINVKTIMITVIVIAIVAIFALLYSNFNMNAKLSEATDKLENYEELQQKNEELKLTILGLEERLLNYADSEEDDDPLPVDEVEGTAQVDDIQGNNAEQPQQQSPEVAVTQQPQTPPASQENYNTYTVVEGDRYWTIAQKTLGDGTLYQRILDANQLTENDYIKPGQILKIPSRD